MTTSRSLMSLRAMTLQPALPLRVGVAVNQRTVRVLLIDRRSLLSESATSAGHGEVVDMGPRSPFSHLVNNRAREDSVFFALMLNPDLYWVIPLERYTSEISAVDSVADWEEL